MSEDISPQELIRQYQESYARHGDTPAGVQWPRGRQSLRFNALTRHFAEDNFSVLDFGCGLGHLKTYLDTQHTNYDYFGADVVPEFVESVQHKYPQSKVQLIDSYKEVKESVDHVVVSGTFNIIVGGDQTAYLEIVNKTLLHLFDLSRVSLAVNFMTDHVDYKQANALHVNQEEMMKFMRSSMSSRIFADSTYMPYEFTLVVLKDNEILRPDNIYRPL
ncbi:class I SAM-dependent methyltransferase [Gammaproteobacteria bacterium]|nr:class I SAM-dependent methyltransferase [Gammaproteobacteria bacterium]